jgi:AraC-like DNA-binding protein/ligand-binding sensor protein
MSEVPCDVTARRYAPAHDPLGQCEDSTMRSAPGTDLLPLAERQLFIEQFGSDVQFLQLLFLLINRSCPIPNVDLVWPEDGSENRSRIRHLGTTEALAGPCSQLLGFEKRNPHPFFCNIINGYGCHETESCGVSDKAAEDVVRQSCKPHVYRCNFGLIDIAVPVLVNGRHIATLLTGQVLTSRPTLEGFGQIARDVAALNWVDIRQLEEAYWQVPVVTQEDIQRTTEILETLAAFLAKNWLRMTESIKERRRKDRELQLSRREFAYLALEWAESEKAKVSTEEIADIKRRIGFTRSPNRVLVIRLEDQPGAQDQKFSLARSLAAVLQVVENLCEKADNAAATRLSMTSICVFLYYANRTPERSNEFDIRRLASRILNVVQELCDVRLRIGIGNPKEDWRGLAESYREACLALAGSDKAIAFYQKQAGSTEELLLHSETLCHLLAENRLEDARSAVSSLPALVSRQLGSALEDFASARLFFTSVIESMSLAARKLGCHSGTISALCDEADAAFKSTSTLFQMHDAWLRFAGEILEQVGQLYVGKHQKIVEHACRMIQSGLEAGRGAQKLSISVVAAESAVSVSHMSRTFRQQTGQTFEQYVITKRVELAKRLLLDPLNNVSEVARRSGFSDPSYFARVFRRLVGCSPREYCDNPHSYHSQPQRSTS